MNGLLIAAVCLLGFLDPAWGLPARKSQGCSISLNEHLPKKNEPLFLIRSANKDLKLAMPETSGKLGSISLRPGEEVIVSCPGKQNSLGITQEEYSSAFCHQDQQLTIKGRLFNSNMLECSHRSAAALLVTDRPCANNNGVMVELGFKVENWHSLVEVCHNIKNSLSYYASHTVYGSSLAGKVIQSNRPGFSRGEKIFYKGFNPDAAFSQNNQVEVFESIFGKKKTAEYFESKKFLARGHLAPDADFLYGSWQHLTYFYINTAPQWQSINAGHWLSIENLVRKIASNRGVDLDVATGTYGVLRLRDDKNREKEVYLQEDNRLPVPDVMWKVLHNPKDNSCIAIVASNNPFLSSPPKTLCPDICRANNWPDLQSDFSKGYVYCCKYQDFVRAVDYAPRFMCKSVLKNE
uniref:Venom nuclease 1 n=1 Tax=Lethocerus distinctifemur TaxID=280095 RepID=A0A2K8JLD9_9HEMI|nr:venom nuclease 1 [Lethocerus distinctifemur]